ncbi:MAG TPA: hypothetical protein VJH90_01095 [archaeon]|nr:hypothetical protein [archaeon]
MPSETSPTELVLVSLENDVTYEDIKPELKRAKMKGITVYSGYGGFVLGAIPEAGEKVLDSLKERSKIKDFRYAEQLPLQEL